MMGWSPQNVIAQLVVVQGANDALYVYSGTADLGNLIESIVSSSTNTTDSLGNTVLPFHALYDNTLHTAITFNGSQQAAYNSVTAPPGPYAWTKTADILLNGQFVFNPDSGSQPVRFGAGAFPLQYFRAFTNQLFVTAANAGPGTSALLEVQGNLALLLASAGVNAVAVLVSGDTNNRLAVDSNGKMQWGSGSAPADTDLYRNAGTLQTDNAFQVQGGSSTASALVAFVLGDTNNRFNVNASGKMQWGSGSAALDTDLYRLLAGFLATDNVIALGNQGSTPASQAGFSLIYSDQFTQLHTDRPIQGDVSLELLNQGSPPGAGGSGGKLFSKSGQVVYISGQAGTGGDQNVYDIGVMHVFGAPAQTINSLSSTAITGASAPVAAGTYILDGIIWCTQGGTNANQAVGVSGPAASTVNVNVDSTDTTAGSSVVALASGRITAINTRSGLVSSGINGGVITNTHTFAAKVRGYMTFTAAGTFALTASCVTAAADTFTVNAFEFDLSPAT